MSDRRPGAAGQPEISRRQLLGRLGAVGGVGVVASLTACTAPAPAPRATPTPTPPSTPAATPRPSPTPRPPVPRGALDVRHFGARGNGRADDTRAIRAALQALQPGGTLVFPAGTYRHSAVLSVAVRGVTLQGPGRLYATAEQQSALRVDAPGVTIRDMTVAMGPTTQRWASEDQHKIFIGPHTGVTVSGVHIQGSAAAGLFCYGADHFRFIDVQVSDTRADGVHMTNGAHHGVVRSPLTMRTGDDGVAVVSYLRDAGPCHDIDVYSPRVRTTVGGRGVSVVGGRDISYHDVDIDRSHAAAVYVACEGAESVTRSTLRVTVSTGSVTNANTNQLVDQGALLVFSGRAGGSVEQVSISGLSVAGTRSDASRQIGVVVDGPDDGVRDVRFSDLHLATRPAPYQGNAPPGSFTLIDVRAGATLVKANR